MPIEPEPDHVNPNHVPAEIYAEQIANFPQVCVEVVLESSEGVLVAKRANEPARGEWFWPGGRLYKDEKLETAAHRVAREELGIGVDLERQLGVNAHFWETSDVPGQPSRHTVNVVYIATPVDDDPAIELDDQHTAYRWLTAVEPELHEYVSQYLEDYDLVPSQH